MDVPFHRLFKTKYCLNSVIELAVHGNDIDSRLKKALSVYFENPYLLTDSCTRALEIAAFCADLVSGDEVILPSYAYVSCAEIFAKHGVKIKFCDSQSNHPNAEFKSIVSLINNQTKAILFVNYGGLQPAFLSLKELCDQKNILLIEDNAHGFGLTNVTPIGHLSCFSFHSTKNIHCYAGGVIQVNEEKYLSRVTNYYHKGTNKSQFDKGEIGYYEWTGRGNSCEIAPLSKVFLLKQLSLISQINTERMRIWRKYLDAFSGKSWNYISDHLSEKKHNAHIFSICLPDSLARSRIVEMSKKQGIALFPHYNLLNKSIAGRGYGRFETPNAQRFDHGLLRLPIYPDLSNDKQEQVISFLLENLRD